MSNITDRENAIIKMGIQTVEVYQKFVSTGCSDKDSYNLMLSSVLGHYHTKISLDDLLMGLNAQVQVLGEFIDEQMRGISDNPPV